MNLFTAEPDHVEITKPQIANHDAIYHFFFSREMAYPWCRVFIVIVVAVTDVAVYIYDMCTGGEQNNPVSYAAHLSGALTGLLVGITCLKNLRWERHERYIWAVSATIFVLLIGSAIVWNLADPGHFVGISKDVASQIDCISDKLI